MTRPGKGYNNPYVWGKRRIPADLLGSKYGVGFADYMTYFTEEEKNEAKIAFSELEIALSRANIPPELKAVLLSEKVAELREVLSDLGYNGSEEEIIICMGPDFTADDERLDSEAEGLK